MVPEAASVLETTVRADIAPLDVVMASNTFNVGAGVARGIDVENLLDGLGNAHV